MELQIEEKYFQMIEMNGKTLEVVPGSLLSKEFEEKDTLTFVCGKNALHRQINAIRHYKTFEQMLDLEDVQLLSPGFSKKRALVEFNRKFPTRTVKKSGGILVISFAEF